SLERLWRLRSRRRCKKFLLARERELRRGRRTPRRRWRRTSRRRWGASMIEFCRIPAGRVLILERCPMQRANLNTDKWYRAIVGELAALVIFLAGCFPSI